MAECMIPLIVLGPKVKFEPAVRVWSASASRACYPRGSRSTSCITARAKTPVKEEVLFQLQVEAGLDDIQPRKEVFSGTEHEYRVRWTPKVDNPTPEEQKAGKSGQAGDGHRQLPLEEPHGADDDPRQGRDSTGYDPHSPPPGQQARQHHGDGPCRTSVAMGEP